MKRSKTVRFSALFLCATLFFTSTFSYASAPNEAEMLKALADAYIVCEQKTASQVMYSNLQGFYSKVREQLPSVNDTELALFTLDYLGSSEDSPILSGDNPLEILEGYSLFTSVEYVSFKENGEVEAVSPSTITPFATWTSEDGRIRLSTSYLEVGSSGGLRRYSVTASANWIYFPNDRLTDTFALAYGGKLDQHSAITASFTHEATCSVCGKKFRIFAQDVYEYDSATGFTRNDAGVELNFSTSHAINSIFRLQNYICNHGTFTKPTTDTKIQSIIGCYLLVDNLTSIQSIYAHKRWGITDITFSAVLSGGLLIPSVSGKIGEVSTEYYAAPVTLFP